MKPGIRSTEFWLVTAKSIILAGLSLAYAFKVGDWQGAITIIGSAIAIASSVQKYIESRTRVKEAYGKN